MRFAPLLAAALTLATATHPTTAHAQNGSTLAVNERLNVGEYLVSDNRQFYAVMQSDGNFCLYKGSGPSVSRGNLWCNSGRSRPSGTYHVQLQTEGQLCSAQMDGAGNSAPLWCTMSTGTGTSPYHVKLANDGDLSVFVGDDDGPGVIPNWSTNTAVRPLAYDQQICFEFNSGVQARGYLWWGEGGQAKSYDTGPQFMVNTEAKCVTLKKGSTAHTIRVTYNKAQVGAWPKACEMTVPWLPVSPSPNLTSPGSIKVIVTGALGNVHCRTCQNDSGDNTSDSSCSNQLPITP